MCELFGQIKMGDVSGRLEAYLTMFSLITRALSLNSFPVVMLATVTSGLEKMFFL